MTTTRIIALGLAVLTAIFGCTLKHKSVNLDLANNVRTLPSEEAALDVERLTRRVTDLYGILSDDKITTYLTKQKIAGFFHNDQDLADFIAVYASMFRKAGFRPERVKRFSIKNILIEENGVIALVELTITGRYYFIWNAKIHEIQRWEKSHGQWYFVPSTY